MEDEGAVTCCCGRNCEHKPKTGPNLKGTNLAAEAGDTNITTAEKLLVRDDRIYGGGKLNTQKHAWSSHKCCYLHRES